MFTSRITTDESICSPLSNEMSCPIASGSCSGTAALRQSPDLWLEDGNIVVQAEQTLFKVLKSILRRESPVFADMLSLPRAPGDSDSYDGCPIVTMYDSAEEVYVFLAAIFIHKYVSRQSHVQSVN